MTRPFVPLRYQRRARAMNERLEWLYSLMSARVSYDERGSYISGFGSKAIAARASEWPDTGTRAWLDSEGARLILQALSNDREGPRILATLATTEDADVDWAIVQHAKLLVPAWCSEVGAHVEAGAHV